MSYEFKNEPEAFKKFMDDMFENRDLLSRLRKDDELARRLYAALCNVIWVSEVGDFGVSWRAAGDLVAQFRCKGEDYLDFYCSGNEGYVDPDIEVEMVKMGWTWKTYPPVKD